MVMSVTLVDTGFATTTGLADSAESTNPREIGCFEEAIDGNDRTGATSVLS